jgi:hypothetical protein
VELTAQQFNDVLASLRQACRVSDGAELRRYGRLEVQTKLAAAIIEDQTTRCYSVLTCDLSIGGIGLYQSTPAPAGGRLLVRLPSSDGSTVVMVCSVAYCNILADGIYGIGAEFVGEADATLVRAAGWTDAPASRPPGRVAP